METTVSLCHQVHWHCRGLGRSGSRHLCVLQGYSRQQHDRSCGVWRDSPGGGHGNLLSWIIYSPVHVHVPVVAVGGGECPENHMLSFFSSLPIDFFVYTNDTAIWNCSRYTWHTLPSMACIHQTWLQVSWARRMLSLGVLSSCQKSQKCLLVPPCFQMLKSNIPPCVKMLHMFLTWFCLGYSWQTLKDLNNPCDILVGL